MNDWEKVIKIASLSALPPICGKMRQKLFHISNRDFETFVSQSPNWVVNDGL